MAPSRKVAPQSIGQVLEIVQAFPQIGIASLAQPGAVFGTDPLHGGLGRQAILHRVFKGPVPAPVMGKHPIGLKHLIGGLNQTMLALKHLVDLGLKAQDCLGQAAFLGLHVVGQKLRGCHRALVQDRDPDGQSVGELGPLQPLGLVGDDFHALELCLRDQFAPGHHLGQNHGDDLQVLDLVLGIDPLGAVLHDKDPDGATPAQQRHAQEGMERVFAGFRAIGEGRMIWGV